MAGVAAGAKVLGEAQGVRVAIVGLFRQAPQDDSLQVGRDLGSEVRGRDHRVAGVRDHDLHRTLAGEWVCLDAITVPEPNGVGVADTALYDERGPVGRAVQTLLIGERARA